MQFNKVSEAPTNPNQPSPRKKFDVADLFSGELDAPATASTASGLDEKARQAYFWIVNYAIISPFYDLEYQDQPPQVYAFGDQQHPFVLPTGQSYASFVLIPLLTLLTRRRCLFVGGPGRGKTASSILMAVLAGYSLQEIRRGIQHGQPEMTVTDLLGNPLPKDLVQADQMDDIRIAWRKWLSMRVKIIDEYNRIPTRTQSALLTLMGDNYAEVLDQIYECPEAAWYLTANDDAGGGTYQVIEALRDRIDVVVKALHFPSRFFGDLLHRMEAGIKPENVVPPEIIFSPEELDRAYASIMEVPIPQDLRRRIEFFASHFEFLDTAAQQFEYKTKDTAKLSGLDFQQIVQADTGRDKAKDVGTTTRNGLSVRAIMTILTYVKAMTWFRGNAEVMLEDVRQMLPFVLHDKLVPNLDAPFFDQAGHGVYRVDRIGWIRKLFDLTCVEFDRLDLEHDDPVGELKTRFEAGLEGLSAQDVTQRLVEIEALLKSWTTSRKLYGHLHDDLLTLKYLHQRYMNYLRWLNWQKN